jgi:citrate lyase subunit beta-like protein
MFARPTSSFKRRPPGSIHSIVARKLNTLRRSYLYVPSSSERMLEKSLTTDSDVIIYDLEDSVPPDPSDKTRARLRLKEFLSVRNLYTAIESECLL